ncbi:PH domain-containing protein [Trueperella pecoris]|uniref:PH domain-containing protein n=1 Tax=Trueperella pecoris TaxID=2733571 RepID=A0A7M1R3Q9_9ACTO|nr:PH domain-containing protein [Trueperella pecoris]QOR48105.1 PH domain-containing protein [Trueperella pecoris]
MKNTLAQSIEFTPLPPQYRTVALIRWTIGVAAVIIAVGVVAWMWGSASMPGLLFWIGAALMSVFALIQIPFALRRARLFGYAERDDELLIRSGVMFQRMTVVPYGRMQRVNVGTGPILKRFGLANIELVTASASTDAKIPGVVLAEAERLREKLTALGEVKMEGL